MLALDGISVRLGSRDILSDVSTLVSPGELTIAVGPNGAGKSTLMKVMTGELAPGTGRVTLRGKPLGDFSPLALARERGVPEDRLVHVWGGAGAADSADVLARPTFGGSPALVDATARVDLTARLDLTVTGPPT